MQESSNIWKKNLGEVFLYDALTIKKGPETINYENNVIILNLITGCPVFGNRKPA